MLFNRKKPIIEYQKDLDPEMVFCENARLLYINGSGALSSTRQRVKNPKWSEEYLDQVTLNGIPLWRVNQSVCPTCESLLATGMGIERAGTKELRQAADKINNGCPDFDTALESIVPILSLLTSGLYIVADKLMFPTDGSGHFFWDVPNSFTSNMATAGLYSYDTCVYTSGEPVYLYPTQSVHCYQEDRVKYYMEQFQKKDVPPRAIAYHCTEWVSFLLDGHHKACAAALLGQPVRCMVIMPYQHGSWGGTRDNWILKELCFEGMRVKAEDVPEKYYPMGLKKTAVAVSSSALPFSGIRPDECSGSLGTRSWEEAYVKAVDKYPKVEQYAIMRAAGVFRVTDQSIQECLAHPDREDMQKLRGILTYMQISGDERLKKTALACAKLEIPEYPRDELALRKYSFEILCRMKEDEEIEQFFINWLAQDEDPHSILGWIASSYWN